MKTNSEQIIEIANLNEELENYFNNTIIPQLFVDAQFKLRKFSPPAMKQFKLKPEYIGMHIEEIKDNFRYPSIIDNIKIVIATGKILEKEIQTTDLSWYQMNILPYLVRKENKTNGVIITFVDITPRVRDLKEQERMLAEHELLLDTIGHDIKNSLLGLSLAVQMLKKLTKKEMDKYPPLLRNVERSLMDTKQIINDLLESRRGEHRYEAEKELVDLQNILEDVRLTLAPQILESNAIIKEDIRASEINFVRRKLRSVMYNLLNNAIKYTPKNRIPEILVKSYRENDRMVISVSDNGIGISKENQTMIFEKFERVRSKTEGSGVGLYLVNTIVNNAGGEIMIESEPDKGTVFKLVFS